MINEFLGIAIVGASLSGVLEFIKAKLGPSSSETKILTIALAIIVGAAYVALQGTPLWPTILGVLGAASTVYALFLK